MTESNLDDVPFGPVAEARLGDLRFVGALTQVDANAHEGDGIKLLSTSHGASNGKDHIDLTALVNAEGTVLAIKYRTLGTGWDLLAYDILSELCIGKQAELYTSSVALTLSPGSKIMLRRLNSCRWHWKVAAFPSSPSSPRSPVRH